MAISQASATEIVLRDEPAKIDLASDSSTDIDSVSSDATFGLESVDVEGSPKRHGSKEVCLALAAQELASAEEALVVAAVPPDVAKLVSIDATGLSVMRCMSVQGFERIGAKPNPRSLLGRGNWGHVWRAQDPVAGVNYAVKNVPRRYAENEVAVMEQLRLQPHPCVGQCFLCHAPALSELSSFVIELCEGGDLVARIAKGRQAAAVDGSVDYAVPAKADAWIAQTFLALEFLHLRAKMIHRDLKPGNLLLGKSDEIKLADFGASHIGLEAPGTWPFNVPPGSPGFAAPEVFRQEVHGPKVDLYSFGVLIYSLLSGESPPTRASSVANGRFAVLCNDYQLLLHALRSQRGQLSPLLPADVHDLVLRLVELKVAERLGLAQIREHVVAQRWKLPAPDASAATIVEWVSSH